MSRSRRPSRPGWPGGAARSPPFRCHRHPPARTIRWRRSSLPKTWATTTDGQDGQAGHAVLRAPPQHGAAVLSVQGGQAAPLRPPLCLAAAIPACQDVHTAQRALPQHRTVAVSQGVQVVPRRAPLRHGAVAPTDQDGQAMRRALLHQEAAVFARKDDQTAPRRALVCHGAPRRPRWPGGVAARSPLSSGRKLCRPRWPGVVARSPLSRGHQPSW